MTEFRSLTWTARVAEGGRVVIPAAARKALGIRPGDEVVLKLKDNILHIFSKKVALRRVQDKIAERARPGVSVSDELIRERREEAGERRS